MEEERDAIQSETAEVVPEETPEPITEQPTRPKNRWESLAVLFLLLIIVVGAYFRFTGLNWDDAYHLHPDERFLTDTAGLLKVTDPISYLKTSESTLNPYNVGKTFYVYGNFPMTLTRLAAEIVNGVCQNFEGLCQYNFVAYDGIHLVGRFLSALVDLVSIGFIFLIGRRLYDWRVGLIAAALLALAVLPIQQSHFFTMDNWAATLTTMTMYGAVRAAEDGRKVRWWVFFGVALGLTVASRINVAPLAAMAGLAAVIWLARRSQEQTRGQSWRYILTDRGSADVQWVIVGVMVAAFLSLFTFRLAQPYAFADRTVLCQQRLAELALVDSLNDPCQSLEAQTGEGLGFFESTLGSIIGFNPNWRSNMSEIQGQQSPDASFPPALQWTDRAPILFPLTNMFWGMGLTAVVAAWLGFMWALWRIVRARPDWTAHALPVAWVGFYFLFMATRWVKSIRYFLPIYPFLFLLAGWALIELWKRAADSENRPVLKKAVAGGLAALVIIPTFLWANAFLDVYREPVTRIQAAAWMFDHVPSGATLLYEVDGESRELQLPLRRYDFTDQSTPPLVLNFNIPEDGVATAVRFNYLSDPDAELTAEDGENLHVSLVNSSTNETIGEAEQSLNLGVERERVLFDIPDSPLTTGTNYTVMATAGSGGAVSAGTSFLMNEHWDDSLPVRYDGRDPYFAYYDSTAGGPIPITNPDNVDKLENFSMWLEQSDYIVLSSQRSVWSTPRLPLTYPMTTRYYEALFSGELGFELVSQFHADLHIGPLYISDVGGEFGWGKPPEIGWPPPGDLAVEEAFSVYDHPPVWLFRKTDGYSDERVRQVLGNVDLSQATFMTPGQATQAPNGLMLSEAEFDVQQANGTFSNVFNVDGVLSRNPSLAAVVWWLAVILLGWLVFPLTFVIFRGLPDRGYPLARILSLLLISYFGWLVASVKVLSHTRNTLLLGVLLIAILSLTIGWFRRRELLAFVRRNLALIGFIEGFALLLYLAFIIIRLGNPDLWDVIWGGEKPMDLSYFSAVLKSTVFPPYDPWFAGGYINYYYYGFVYVGSLTKLLGIVPNVAYNLILPMLFSFTGMGVFSLAYNLVAWKKSREENNQSPITNHQSINQPDQSITQPLPLHRKAVAAGVVAAVLCVFLGNLAEVPLVVSTWNRASTSTLNTGIGPVDAVVHTASGALNLAFTEATAPVYPGDWFWNATRVINFREGEVQPITEFPFFTFLYGDLHAHMIALPLSILALGWAVSLALQGQQARGRGSSAVTALQWVVGGITIGSLQATNTWDFPTYLFIGVLAVTFNAYRQHAAVNLRMLGQAGVQSVALVALSLLTFLPFTQNYGVGYSSFSLWPGSYTHLSVYLVVYGLFLFFVFTHLARELRAWTRSWSRESLEGWRPLALPVIVLALIYVAVIIFLLMKDYWIAPFVLTLIILAGLLGLRPNLPPNRRIPLILISSALGLTMLVELVVLDGDIGRMNTVFKFYMQVWVMLSVVGGVAAAMAWPAVQARRNRISGRVWRYGLALLLAAAVLYPILATKAKWDIRMSAEAPTTLDGMAFMQTTEYQDNGQVVPLHFDYDALQWMRRNISGSPVVAEAHASNPYRAIGSRVAMFTGLPTIIGWDWHQRQQRAVVPGTLVGNRITDVNTLYSTTNTAEALSILEKYEVGYIYVGQLEWVYYTPDGLNKFDSMADQGLLEEVYRNAGVSIYEVMATEAVGFVD